MLRNEIPHIIQAPAELAESLDGLLQDLHKDG